MASAFVWEMTSCSELLEFMHQNMSPQRKLLRGSQVLPSFLVLIFFRVGSWSLKCIKFFVVVMYLALINLPVSSGGSTAGASATCGSICCQA